jgi:hypothetical protein
LESALSAGAMLADVEAAAARAAAEKRRARGGGGGGSCCWWARREKARLLELLRLRARVRGVRRRCESAGRRRGM